MGSTTTETFLSVSPLLLDRYMSAARLVTRLANWRRTFRLPISTYDIRKLTFQKDKTAKELPFGSRGGIAIRHRFPVDGEYVLRIRLQYMDKEGSGISLSRTNLTSC